MNNQEDTKNQDWKFQGTIKRIKIKDFKEEQA
jgi:hypothetical protein